MKRCDITTSRGKGPNPDDKKNLSRLRGTRMERRISFKKTHAQSKSLISWHKRVTREEAHNLEDLGRENFGYNHLTNVGGRPLISTWTSHNTSNPKSSRTHKKVNSLLEGSWSSHFSPERPFGQRHTLHWPGWGYPPLWHSIGIGHRSKVMQNKGELFAILVAPTFHNASPWIRSVIGTTHVS